MQTVILSNPGSFELIDTQYPPAPASDEAQVRVRRVGICGTDIHAFAGRQPFFTYPRILGHELAVEIVALGSTDLPHNLQIGDRCAVRPYLNCGVCGPCRRGDTNCCVKLQVLGVHCDGGMREIINVPIDNLRKSLLPDEQLAIVEMLGIGAHAVRRAQIVPGEFALVIGLGPIGLGVSQFAHLAGARIIALDVSSSRLQFASRQRGVEFCIDGSVEGDIGEQLKAIVGDELPTLVFDATGSSKSMHKSFDYVANGGKLIYVGLFQGDVTFHDPDFHRRELTLLASRNATKEDFENVLGALEEEKIEVASWITHHASPQEMIGVFSSWLEPSSGVIKAMLDFA